ncbi:MAG: hypothetical protein IB618_03400 [Candidatus Pacearchaeota archaeon]|nr:MAG: hypothetical protein IB618_03400 [Candidatus Pacearchaeota archaeon]
MRYPTFLIIALMYYNARVIQDKYLNQNFFLKVIKVKEEEEKERWMKES